MKYIVYFLISSVLGLGVSIVALLVGISVKPFAPFCAVVLRIGSQLADALPGGGMHNPIADVIGLLVNGIILGSPLCLLLSCMMRKRAGVPRQNSIRGKK